MKIFISSVRRGLERERDSLPGLIRALGHEAILFEDLGAQPIPSREVCLRSVEAADVYLLLLGAFYGDRLPETGLSPSHEEYVAAISKGIPRLAFTKTGVNLEDAQRAFKEEVEAYATGLFRANFTDAADLQPKVVTAVRDIANLQAVVWTPLPRRLDVEWREDWAPLPKLRGQSMPATKKIRISVAAVDAAAIASAAWGSDVVYSCDLDDLPRLQGHVRTVRGGS